VRDRVPHRARRARTPSADAGRDPAPSTGAEPLEAP